MTSSSLLMVSLSLISYVRSIPCDFKFLDFDPSENLDGTNFLKYELTTTTLNPRLSYSSFECEERDDNFVEEKLSNQSSTQLPKPDQQFLFNQTDEDEYEDLESTCQVSRRTIQPKALNNIYNKLTKVINTSSFIQSISIEQCLSKTEECNGGTATPIGKKHICRQKHVQITLKALKEGDDGNAITDEQFYYPSHCVCELVTVKKRKRLSKCKPVVQKF